jgi:hypothetical protein
MIEVKSVLQSTDFLQMSEQQASFRKMKLAMTTPDRKLLLRPSCVGVPQFIFAFETGCSQSTLNGWFAQEPFLTGLCVMNKYALLRDPNTLQIEEMPTDGNGFELLHLVCRIHSTLAVMPGIQFDTKLPPNGLGAFEPDLGAYLTYDVP